MKQGKFDNPDFIPFAVDDLGGTGEFVDVEDVFVRCHKLSRERFGWRTKDYPNYKIASKALRDFEEDNPSLLIRTPDGLRRQLSAEGIEWVRRKRPLFGKVVGAPGRNPPRRRTGQRFLNDVEDHPLCLHFVNGEAPELTKHLVADLLLLSPDSSPEKWSERLETFRSAAADSQRVDVLSFLDYLKAEQPDWFKGVE